MALELEFEPGAGEWPNADDDSDEECEGSSDRLIRATRAAIASWRTVLVLYTEDSEQNRLGSVKEPGSGVAGTSRRPFRGPSPPSPRCVQSRVRESRRGLLVALVFLVVEVPLSNDS